MNLYFNTGISRTKVLIASVLLCSAFGYSVTAQTTDAKPMTDKALSALIVELKEVVAKSAPDAKDAALIAARWDKRTDLKGKTKTQVLLLLFEDVKAVIQDSGIQYQIKTIFSSYKYMPDQPQSADTPKKSGALTKAASVKKLVELTFPMHPYVGIEEQLASLPGTSDIREEEERVRRVRIEVFDEALIANNRLTPEQKEFVKANYDRLSKIVDRTIDDTIKANFPTEQWVKEGLQQSYAAKLTVKELTSLIAYFQGAGGQTVLKYVRLTNMAQLIIGNGGTLDYTPEDKAAHDKFAATPLGRKFLTGFIKDAEAYEKRKENAARARDSNADGFAILEVANLNKLFNEFVAENYKK
jgi:hypothetical protein